jgi:hypothetical protein
MRETNTYKLLWGRNNFDEGDKYGRIILRRMLVTLTVRTADGWRKLVIVSGARRC